MGGSKKYKKKNCSVCKGFHTGLWGPERCKFKKPSGGSAESSLYLIILIIAKVTLERALCMNWKRRPWPHNQIKNNALLHTLIMSLVFIQNVLVQCIVCLRSFYFWEK